MLIFLFLLFLPIIIGFLLVPFGIVFKETLLFKIMQVVYFVVVVVYYVIFFYTVIKNLHLI